jgi:alpha-L-fucosidase 2
LISELFKNCIQTLDILKTEEEFSQQLKDALAKLLPYTIGSKGQLLEWANEWKAVDPSHRHLSHMYPVFPGAEISPATTPSLSEAAKKALTLREKTNCSWGFAWKAACWARLGEADSAWQTWQYQLRWVDPKSTSSLNNYGLFPNLFNSDGRDVIMNGNGCATAVMAEMLIQSHTGAIEFLPALPKLFPAGKVKGLKTRGGFVVDLEWLNGQVKGAIIYSNLGNDCRFRMKVKPEIWQADKKIAVNNMDKNVYSFKTVKGKKYDLRINPGKR